MFRNNLFHTHFSIYSHFISLEIKISSSLLNDDDVNIENNQKLHVKQKLNNQHVKLFISSGFLSTRRSTVYFFES